MEAPVAIEVGELPPSSIVVREKAPDGLVSEEDQYLRLCFLDLREHVGSPGVVGEDLRHVGKINRRELSLGPTRVVRTLDGLELAVVQAGVRYEVAEPGLLPRRRERPEEVFVDAAPGRTVR